MMDSVTMQSTQEEKLHVVSAQVMISSRRSRHCSRRAAGIRTSYSLVGYELAVPPRNVMHIYGDVVCSNRRGEGPSEAADRGRERRLRRWRR